MRFSLKLANKVLEKGHKFPDCKALSFSGNAKGLGHEVS